jgi:DNA repair protein RecO (recombination protein O)
VKPLLTKGIVLNRTDFGEADRILTVLTADAGKLRLMAKGVRRIKSKLAGGIELFSVSDITYMKGRGEIATLLSSRLDRYYANIVKDLDRVQLGYDLIKTLDKATEDEPEPEYFDLLNSAFEVLDTKIDNDLVRLWFQAQLLRLSGHSPNLKTDTAGNDLSENQKYNFDLDAMTFSPNAKGRYTAGHIKAMRLLGGHNSPENLQKVAGLNETFTLLLPLVNDMLRTHIRTWNHNN